MSAWDENSLKDRLKELMLMTEDDLLAVVNDASKPYFDRKIAIAINKGDWKTLQSMINQVYGNTHAGGRPTNELKDLDKEWADNKQINSAKLKEFIYQKSEQSNNPITVETLIDLKTAFSIGCSQNEACEYAGITPVGYCKWKREMPDDLKVKWDFLVAKWQNQMILKARDTIRNNLDDPMTSKWYLERKRRDEFATRTEQELKRVEKFSDLSDDDLNNMIGVVNGDSE
jgi:hypothetical protein